MNLNNIKILALGDIVGQRALERVCAIIGAYRRDNGISFVIANGENANCGNGNGITVEQAEKLLTSGIDVITTGNHVWRQRSIYEMLDSSRFIIRPANYPAADPGSGYTKVESGGITILVANLAGRVGMDPCSCPFEAADAILAKEKGSYDISVFDFHAEATSEKFALAAYLDGRADIVFGTHTHVPTADERILPGGSAFITDIGMCGSENSALGVETQGVIEKFRTGMPQKFKVSDNKTVIQGALFTLDAMTHKPCGVVRIHI